MNIKKSVCKLYEKNRRIKDGFQYTVPSPSSYPYQWLWDSCFHTIALSHFDIESAKKELRSVTAKQFESGLLPHIIYWHPQDKLQFDWGVSGTSAITQPPIIAYAVWRVFEKDPDRYFLRELYPKLQRYFDYLLTRKDTTTGLVGIIHPDESGEDDSPRFDSALGLRPTHSAQDNNKKRFALFTTNKDCQFDAQVCMREHFWVQDVAFNSYLVEGLATMAKIAAELNLPSAMNVYHDEAATLRKAMRKYMLKENVCWSLDKDGEPIEVVTWSMFTPLLADIYSDAEACSLVSQYLRDDCDFCTKYPVPSTGVSEPGYQPLESTTEPAELHPNWRGPVWMAANWFTYRGLMKYGFEHEALQLAKQSKKLIKQSGFREYYHPTTGKGMGAKDFTWGGLILDMTD